MPERITLPTYIDDRGKLTVLEKILPFEVKRFYYIYEVDNPEIKRGGHRHKRNYQALICLKGQCTIYNNNGNVREEFNLTKPSECLILHPDDWHYMYHFSPDAILLVLASEHYDMEDYIDEPYP